MAALHLTGRSLGGLLSGLMDLSPAVDRAVGGLATDSRRVGPGDLFLARRGERADARAFIGEAIGRGAVAVIEDGMWTGVRVQGSVPVVTLPSLSEHTGRIASRFFGDPSRALWVAGVTGTNGKTSVTHFAAQVLDAHRPGSCGIMGTLGYGAYGALSRATHTTPDAVQVHRLLAGMREQGLRFVAMEVSSHALSQGRVGAVSFDVAVFTNLSRDHLDYHGDLETYAAEKARLFAMPGLAVAVVNIDDPTGRRLAASLRGSIRLLDFSLDPSSRAAIRCKHLEIRPDGVTLEVVSPEGTVVIESALMGRFNAANLLASLGLLLCAGMDLEEAARGLSAVEPVDGRMERLGGVTAPFVVVDYAHTPDALDQVLSTLAEHCSGRLVCVFGCGGGRDRGKRPEMGSIAERLADRIVLTADNPRGEDPARIIRDILQGVSDPSVVTVIPDREAAIREAIGSASTHDVVLVAGKGHEDYQEANGIRLPFSDRQVVRSALEALQS